MTQYVLGPPPAIQRNACQLLGSPLVLKLLLQRFCVSMLMPCCPCCCNSRQMETLPLFNWQEPDFDFYVNYLYMKINLYTTLAGR